MRGLAVLTSFTLVIIASLGPLGLTFAQEPENRTSPAINPADLIPFFHENSIPYFDPGSQAPSPDLDPLAPSVTALAPTPTPAPTRRQYRRKKPQRPQTDGADSNALGDATSQPESPPLPPTPEPTEPQTTRTPAPTPAPTPAMTPEVIVPGSQCTANYTYGPKSVSVEGGGIFCAFPPICSGEFGNCPLLQPGLGAPSRCVIVRDKIYGCVP